MYVEEFFEKEEKKLGYDFFYSRGIRKEKAVPMNKLALKAKSSDGVNVNLDAEMSRDQRFKFK